MVFRELLRIAAPGIRSLVWSGDTLVDWAGGGKVIRLDGSVQPSGVNYAYRFDAACTSPSGEFAVIYERLGTKGLVLHGSKVVREINRSFYHAEVFEFPVCTARLVDGREVLIHCPEEYNRLEIDDLKTGERLTACDGRKPVDFFYSRLAVSPNGRKLISAGWIWHPVDAVRMFDIGEALADPRTLDDLSEMGHAEPEVSAAAFLDDQNLVLATTNETFMDEEELAVSGVLLPSSLAVWNLLEKRIVSQVAVTELPGTIMPVGPDHVVGFNKFPRVFELKTGKIVASLPDLQTGEQCSSIVWHIDAVPPLALDVRHRRFAVASEHEVRVVSIEP